MRIRMNGRRRISGLLLSAAAIMVIAMLFCSVRIISAQAGEKTGSSGRRISACYMDVKLTPNDSFESLAERFNDRSAQTDEEYISELRRINSLHAKEALHPGCHVTVAYYPDRT